LADAIGSSPEHVRQAAPGALAIGLGRGEIVAEVARQLGPLERDATVVVAHSGGPDSTALLFLVAEARPDLQVVPVHVRHGLRDDAADVAAVRLAGQWLGILPVIRRVEVQSEGGPEAAARAARWNAVAAVARDLGADAVLLGHTADDQAETVLLQAARGAGLRGLSAMAAWRHDEVGMAIGRPLLRVRRADVHDLVTGDGLPSVADPSNDDPTIRRNLVRQVVLPAMDTVSGDAAAALVRLADLARLDDDTLDEIARRALEAWGNRWGPGWAVDASVVDDLPGVARRVVLRMVEAVGATAIDAALLTSILELDSGRERHAAGLRASRDRRWLAMVPAGIAAPAAAPLPMDRDVSWGQGLVVVVTQPPGGSAGSRTDPSRLDLGLVDPPSLPAAALAPPPGGRADRATVLLPAGLGELTVRPRRSGDRVHTAAGTRTVAAVLADHGVPRVLRDHVPLLELGGRIVWVAGVDGDVEFIARGLSGPALRVSLCRAGETEGAAPL